MIVESKEFHELSHDIQPNTIDRAFSADWQFTCCGLCRGTIFLIIKTGVILPSTIGKCDTFINYHYGNNVKLITVSGWKYYNNNRWKLTNKGRRQIFKLLGLKNR